MNLTTARLPIRPVRSAAKLAQSGFTLVEMIVVIVIMGVIGAAVAVFIKSPIDAYVDSARRARLTDVADTTLRRMTRDIRTALPNSLRQASGSNAANNQCIEFIPTKTGGRYRAEVDTTGQGDPLRFDAADSSFDMYGANSTLPDQSIVAGDLVVIYNLGVPGADAYDAVNPNVSAVTRVSAGSLPNETKLSINALQFPLASGSNRFQVIPGSQKIVSYVCSGGNMYRHSNYAYASSCPSTGGDLIAKDVSCTFVYNGSDLQRNALVQIKLALTSGGETVNLYHEVHVSNSP